MVVNLIKEGTKVLSLSLYKTIQSFFYMNIMTEVEAHKILNIKSKSNIYDNYKYLYEINSKTNNGSPYLQSRIKNAYNFIKYNKKINPK